MRRAFAILCVAMSAIASAAEPKPVLVVFQDTVGIKANNAPSLLMLGLGAWANHYINKHSAERVARFHESFGAADLSEQIARNFGCFGAEPACGSLALTDERKFEQLLADRADHSGIVIGITPELISEQMMLRAESHEVQLVNKKGKNELQPGRSYVVLATMRAPPALADQRKTDPAALDAWWHEGTPTRLETQTRRGLDELAALFATLVKEGGHGAKMPDAWKALPKVNPYAKDQGKGRIACSGIAWCNLTRVLEDRADGFVLVSDGATAGWFDADAAAKETNLPAFATMGIPMWK